MDSLDSFPAATSGAFAALASAGELPVGTPQALLDVMPHGVLVLTPAGTVAYLNGSAAALWGVPARAVIGHEPARVSPAVLPPALLAALAQPAAPPADYWLPHTQQWICLRTAPAPEGQRWVFWDDVTARHQAEAAQQRGHDLLLAVEEVARTGSYEADLATGAFYFSDGLYRLFGEAPQAFVPTLEVIEARSHPDDAATVQAVLSQAVASRQPYQYRRRIYRPDGAERTLEAHGEVRCDEAGTPVQLRGLVQDVTERVQAEQAREEARALLQATIDSSPDLVQVFEAVRDARGAVVDFTWVLNNAVAERAYGDVIGQRLCQRNPGVVEEGIFDTFKQVLETGVPDQSERRYAHEQFDGWFVQTTAKLGDGVATTTHDITVRKRAEREVLRLKDELTQRVTDKYQALFHAMDQGFCVLQLLFDDTGQRAEDFRYLEVNPVFARQSGLTADVLGKTVRELVPDLEPFWFDTYGRVALTGEAVRVVHHVPQVGRWFDVHAFRAGELGEGKVCVLFTDVTDHQRDEQRRAYLLRLSDALRARSDAREIEQAVTAEALRFFQADRCYYCTIEDGAAVIRRDAYRDGLPAIAGTYPLAHFDLLSAVLETGRPFVAHDVHTAEVVNDALLALLLGVDIQAFINVPVVKAGRVVGVFTVAQSAPRTWTEAELAAAADTAERTWAAAERAVAEEALRESEEQFRAVANLVPDLLWRSNAAGETSWYNQRWYEYTGQTPAEAAGYGWADALHPDDRAASAQHYRAAVRSGQPLQQEHRICSAAGEYRWFQVQALAIRDAQGRVGDCFGAATDIHPRKLAEAALAADKAWLEREVAARTQARAANRDLLQSVFDTNLIALSVLEAVRDEAGTIQDFRLVLVSRELERETGRTDLVGKLYAQEFPGIRAVGIFDLAVRALATGEPQGTEYYYPHEGFGKWYACQFVKLGDGVVATNLDITARKQAEEERLKNLRLLEQAEAVAGLGSWDYEPGTGAMRWSDGMYALFGLPPGSAVTPYRYLEAVLAEDRPRAEQLVRQLAAGQGVKETLRLRVAGQVKTVRTKAVVQRAAADQPARVLGVDLDISELQRLEADNLRLRLTQQRALFEAVQAAQEAERKRIAEGLHNGIGQLLFATKLRLDRLQAPLLGSDPALGAARREADQLLAEAIRQTRALSHELVPQVLEEFGLAAAVHNICRQLSSPQLLLHCHVELDPDVPPPPALLQLALYRMAQELAQNIVKHARRATEASLELETMPGWVLLRAEDNGPGFAPDPAASPGLGLRTIRDRVALLGGQVESGSAAAGGAYVRIRIPLSASPAA